MADAAARVRQLGDPLLSEHAESAMRKLACDLPVDAAGGARRRDPRLVPARSAAAADLLVTLGQALESRKRVTFRYHTMGTDSTGRREVEPFGLFFLNQHWYLAARAPGEELVKNYRLNRIEAAEVNKPKPKAPDYEIPESFHLREHARSRHAWELGAGDAVEATVAFRARTGAASAAFRLGEAVEGHPDRRRFRVRRTDAFARWLLSFGGDLVPVAPREIVDEYHGLVRETLAHHAAGPPHDRSTPPSSSAASSTSSRISPTASRTRWSRWRDARAWIGAVVLQRHPVDLRAVRGARRVRRGTPDLHRRRRHLGRPQPLPPPHAAHPERAARPRARSHDAPGRAAARGAPRDRRRARSTAARSSPSCRTTSASDDFRAASLSSAGDLEHLRSLREAFRRRRKVRLTYRKADEDAPSHRVICPYGIVFASGMWYAVAHCESSDGIRIFRLDRVEQVETLDARFESPAQAFRWTPL